VDTMTGEDQQQQTAAPDEGTAPAREKAEPSPEPKDEGPSLSDLGRRRGRRGRARLPAGHRSGASHRARPCAAPAAAKAGGSRRPEEPVYATPSSR